MERLLEQAGSDKTRLLQATIYCQNLDDYDAVNRVWDAWIPEGAAPVRACVAAKLSNPKFRIEIVLTAAAAGI